MLKKCVLAAATIMLALVLCACKQANLSQNTSLCSSAQEQTVRDERMSSEVSSQKAGQTESVGNSISVGENSIISTPAGDITVIPGDSGNQNKSSSGNETENSSTTSVGGVTSSENPLDTDGDGYTDKYF